MVLEKYGRRSFVGCERNHRRLIEPGVNPESFFRRIKPILGAFLQGSIEELLSMITLTLVVVAMKSLYVLNGQKAAHCIRLRIYCSI